jgi:hypothetical protein
VGGMSNYYLYPPQHFGIIEHKRIEKSEEE